MRHLWRRLCTTRRHVIRKVLLLALVVCLCLAVLLLWCLPTTTTTTNTLRQQTQYLILPSHRLCILVPHRDRFEELQTFVPYMHSFLNKQNLTFHILILNQVDNLRFNRASLLNVGYYEALQLECDYLCLHDVDLVPLTQEIRYDVYPESGPMHLASNEYHPRYNYTKYIGGIMLITTAHFRQINGMSNKYWGWGLEDDELFLRFRDTNLTIYRPSNLTTNNTNTFAHMHDARVRLRDNVKLPKQEEMTHWRDRISGVDTIRYHVYTRVDMTINKAPCLIINVQLYCDKQWTPYCELPRTRRRVTNTTTTLATMVRGRRV